MPWPPPMHMVASANCLPSRFSSDAALPVMRAPVAPSGWPSASAPPSIFILARSMPRSWITDSDCAENASFSSMMSMSPRLQAGALQHLLGRRHRADAHDLRRAAGDGHRLDPRQRLEAVRLGIILGHHQHGRGAVGQRRGGAGGDRTVDVERRLQAGQAFQAGVGADGPVGGHDAALGLDRHDLVIRTCRPWRQRRRAVDVTAKPPARRG
jgi:hypothetical protein